MNICDILGRMIAKNITNILPANIRFGAAILLPQINHTNISASD
jgi:hypothetical protein